MPTAPSIKVKIFQTDLPPKLLSATLLRTLGAFLFFLEGDYLLTTKPKTGIENSWSAEAEKEGDTEGEDRL